MKSCYVVFIPCLLHFFVKLIHLLLSNSLESQCALLFAFLRWCWRVASRSSLMFLLFDRVILMLLLSNSTRCHHDISLISLSKHSLFMFHELEELMTVFVSRRIILRHSLNWESIVPFFTMKCSISMLGLRLSRHSTKRSHLY